MSRFRSRLRAAAVAGGLGLVAALLASPSAALAGEGGGPAPDVFVPVGGIAQGLGPDSAGKPAPVWFSNFSTGDIQGVVVTVDRKSVRNVLTVEAAKGSNCNTTDTTITCDIGTIHAAEFAQNLMTLTLRVASGAAVGTHATLRLHVDGWYFAAVDVTDDIVVAKDSPDLVAANVLLHDVVPGTGVDLPVAVRNSGDRTAQDVVMEFASQDYRYLRYVGNASNCVADASATPPAVVCAMADALAPGQTYGMPLRMQVSAHTPGPTFLGGYYVVMAGDAVPSKLRSLLATGRHGTGAPLRLTQQRTFGAKVAPEADPSDNVGVVAVHTTANYADLAAIGASVTGSTGSTVPVQVGVKNNGPADTASVRVGPVGSLEVTAPANTIFASVPKACAPVLVTSPWGDSSRSGAGGYSKYFCEIGRQTGMLAAGATERFGFTLKINGTATGPAGSVVAHFGSVPDLNSANDTAAIHLTLQAPGINPAPAGGGAHGGGTLPVTGLQVGVLGGLGVAVLAAGALLIVVARRRPATIFAAGDDA